MRSLYKNNMTILYLGFSLDNLTIFCFSVFCLIISSAKKIGRPFLANLPTYYVPFQSLNALPTYLPKMGTSLMDVPLLEVKNVTCFLQCASQTVQLVRWLSSRDWSKPKFNQISTTSFWQIRRQHPFETYSYMKVHLILALPDYGIFRWPCSMLQNFTVRSIDDLVQLNYTSPNSTGCLH